MNPSPVEGIAPLAVLDAPHELQARLRDDPRGLADQVHRLRRRHGAVLLRGLDFCDPAGVEDIAGRLCGELGLLAYEGERASPRRALGGHVYTSTEYKAGESIFMHNECSSRLEWPLVLMFACGVPAAAGGATPLCDMRRVTRTLDPAIQEQFARRGIEYTRNYGGEFGVTLDYAFGTTDQAAIEAYCAARGIDWQWLGPDSLRTRFRRASHALHPETGERLWFNYATFYSRSALDPRLRRLMRGVPEERRPFSAAWADGEPIADEIFDACRESFVAATHRFDWRRGDFLVLDNMLSGHGRDPFQGDRLTYVVMAGEVRRPQPMATATECCGAEEVATC